MFLITMFTSSLCITIFYEVLKQAKLNRSLIDLFKNCKPLNSKYLSLLQTRQQKSLFENTLKRKLLFLLIDFTKCDDPDDTNPQLETS